MLRIFCITFLLLATALPARAQTSEPACLTFYRERYHRSFRLEKKVKSALYAAGAVSYAGGVFVSGALYPVGAVVALAAWLVDAIERNYKAYTILKEAHEAAVSKSTKEIRDDPDSVFYHFFYKDLHRADEIAAFLEKTLNEENGSPEGPCARDEKGRFRFKPVRTIRRYVLSNI